MIFETAMRLLRRKKPNNNATKTVDDKNEVGVIAPDVGRPDWTSNLAATHKCREESC